jgi:hypothetical protein
MSTTSNPVNYIFPLNANAGYYFDNGEPVSVQGFHHYVVPQGKTEWGISSNFRNVEAGDRIWAYFGGKDRVVCGMGYVWTQVHPPKGPGRHRITIEWDQDLTASLRSDPIQYEEFQQWVAGPIAAANSRTDRVLESWLASHGLAAHRNHSAVRGRFDHLRCAAQVA